MIDLEKLDEKIKKVLEETTPEEFQEWLSKRTTKADSSTLAGLIEKGERELAEMTQWKNHPEKSLSESEIERIEKAAIKWMEQFYNIPYGAPKMDTAREMWLFLKPLIVKALNAPTEAKIREMAEEYSSAFEHFGPARAGFIAGYKAAKSNQ